MGHPHFAPLPRGTADRLPCRITPTGTLPRRASDQFDGFSGDRGPSAILALRRSRCSMTHRPCICGVTMPLASRTRGSSATPLTKSQTRSSASSANRWSPSWTQRTVTGAVRNWTQAQRHTDQVLTNWCSRAIGHVGASGQPGPQRSASLAMTNGWLFVLPRYRHDRKPPPFTAWPPNGADPKSGGAKGLAPRAPCLCSVPGPSLEDTVARSLCDRPYRRLPIDSVL